MSSLDDLLRNLFETRSAPFASEMASWLRASRRFKEFVTRYRGKIRTKLKTVRDEHGLKDVRAELYTAAVLLREERFTLDYETYAAIKQRGPDLTVTFKTHTPFNVEVRRIRSVDWDDDEERQVIKLMHILCEKVRQMPPSIINVLWLVSERDIDEDALQKANLLLRQLADQKVELFFTQRGFVQAADFLKQYRHLSGIGLVARTTCTLWLNNTARHPVPPDIARALQRIMALPD